MASSGKESTPENYFFVDTKNTCFLCLNEFDPSIVSSGGGRKRKSAGFGGKNGGCQETGRRDQQVKFFLKKIFHYLRLDTEKIFDGVTNAGGSPLFNFGGAEPLDKIADFSVLLCKDCCGIAKKLSDLCEELELLKNQVDQTLRKFHGKLVYCSEINSLVEVDQVRNELVSPIGLELVHAMVADILREKTKEKCCLKLKIAMPRAKLYQTAQGRNLLTTTGSESPEGSIVKLEHPELSMTPVPDDEAASNTELSEADMYQIISFKLPTMAEIPQIRDNNNFVTCSLCPVSANSVFSKELLFQRHVTCCHLDFLFASLKLPLYSMEQFKAYCEHLLEQEIKASEQGDMNKKKNSDQTPGFICHICGDIFHEVKVILGHLVLSHYEALAQKLVQLQKSTTITPEELMSKKSCDIFSIEGPKFKCDDCGRVFAAPSSLYRHKRVPCRQRSDTSGHKTINRPFICAHCGLSFTSAYGRKIHTKRIHLGINHNRDRTTCELCGKTMSVSSIGRHKNVSCPVRLGKKEKVQSTNPPSASNDYSQEQEGPSEVKHDYPYYLNENLKIEVVDDEEEEEEEEDAENFYNNGNVRNSVLVMSHSQTGSRGSSIDDDDDSTVGVYDQEKYQDVEMIEVGDEEDEDEDPLQTKYEQNKIH